MNWDKYHNSHAEPDSNEGATPDEVYKETEEERRAYIDELRAQIASGTYKPSIGRISVNIVGDLAD